MGLASKLNKNIIDWKIDTKGLEFVKASELEKEKEYPFLGCWVSADNGYGEGGVIITKVGNELKLVNTPASFVENIKSIRSDKDGIQQILEGKLNFYVKEIESKKFKRKGCIVELVDVE